ncbi:MAG: Gfo/Idh/MocA family oxidoreductase [Eubacteriales bacterium]|nr:Gfo/Idh/MocA family oxidoreductase [Eubacteriales bacterium]
MWKIGVIGCGKIAQVRHFPEYSAREDVKIAALFDMNPVRTREMAEKFGAKAYDSYKELLADSQIDAVSVCSSNASHAEISIAALNAGKHVLCEKPMAVTLEDCEAMVEAAKRNHRLLMIDQNQRLTDAHQQARELIRKGAIGRPLTFRTSFRHGGPETWSVDPGSNTWFFDKSKAAMGAMADLGIHKTDLIQFLLDQRIVETTATLCTLDKKFSDGSPITVDDNAFCIYRMSGGATGIMTASWTNYGSEDNSTMINGTEGILRIYDDPDHPLILMKKNGETQFLDAGQIQTNDHQTQSGVIDMFVECLNHPAKEGISGESVLDAMRAVFASLDSSERGCSVRI